MQNFRHLDVWSRSHALARTIHRLARTFGDATDDFKAQLTSAAESIPSNVVEGCGAATNREFARFLDISIKSAFELDYRLELAKDYGYITKAEWRALFDDVGADQEDVVRLPSRGAGAGRAGAAAKAGQKATAGVARRREGRQPRHGSPACRKRPRSARIQF